MYLAEERSSEEQAAYFSLRHLSTSKPVVLRTQHLIPLKATRGRADRVNKEVITVTTVSATCIRHVMFSSMSEPVYQIPTLNLSFQLLRCTSAIQLSVVLLYTPSQS